jgi:hypothetical protein
MYARSDGVVADHHQRDQSAAGDLPQGDRGGADVSDPDRPVRGGEHQHGHFRPDLLQLLERVDAVDADLLDLKKSNAASQ